MQRCIAVFSIDDKSGSFLSKIDPYCKHTAIVNIDPDTGYLPMHITGDLSADESKEREI